MGLRCREDETVVLSTAFGPVYSKAKPWKDLVKLSSGPKSTNAVYELWTMDLARIANGDTETVSVNGNKASDVAVMQKNPPVKKV